MWSSLSAIWNITHTRNFDEDKLISEFHDRRLDPDPWPMLLMISREQLVPLVQERANFVRIENQNAFSTFQVPGLESGITAAIIRAVD